MMRWFSFPFCFLVLPSIVQAQIVLNEVYYDHPGLDGGYEFVEIFNPAPVTASLAGYALEFHDGNSSGWKTIWQASPADSVGGSALFVVGGSRVAPPPDATMTGTLQNGPDAVRLVRDGGEVDRLGYGALVDPAFFETRPAPDVAAGSSLGRWPDGIDSDDNLADFRVLDPSPRRFNLPRSDIAVARDSRTLLRKALPVGGADAIFVWLHNRGTESVNDPVMVELIDSTDSSVRILETQETSVPLPAGDSVSTMFEVTFDPGYHTLGVVAPYTADDRPANNRLQLFRRAGSPPVLISEVMSHPAAGCPEYVELYNAGPAPYDLAGHRLRDRVSRPTLVATDAVEIAPGGFVVVTPDGVALRSWFPGLAASDVVEVPGGWPALNHASGGTEADSVLFLDRFLLAVDRVSYPAQPGDSRGRSLERVDLYPGEDRHVWVLSSQAGGGSPAGPNPSGMLVKPRGGGLTLSSNPFDPGAGEPLLITVPARAGPGSAIVNLFDIRGRQVRDIGSTTQLPFVFTWDGTDNRGRVVTPGLYVIACQYTAQAGGRGRVEKVVLGCAQGIR